MGFVSGSKCDLCDVYCAHAQFAPGTFQAYPTDISGNVLTYTASEDAMKVRHREVGNCRQYFSIERFINVLTNEVLDSIDALSIVLKAVSIIQHMPIIVCQNFRSLLQAYHVGRCLTSSLLCLWT